jgi:hypothetical protein
MLLLRLRALPATSRDKMTVYHGDKRHSAKYFAQNQCAIHIWFPPWQPIFGLDVVRLSLTKSAMVDDLNTRKAFKYWSSTAPARCSARCRNEPPPTPIWTLVIAFVVLLPLLASPFCQWGIHRRGRPERASSSHPSRGPAFR